MPSTPREREATTTPKPDQPPAKPAEQDDEQEVTINTTFSRRSDEDQ